MKPIYDSFVQPYKIDYILMGALIVLIEILNNIFGDHVSAGFLIGLPLFALSFLFLNVLFKIQAQFFHNKKFTIGMFFYSVLFSLFVIAFLFASYSRHPKPFAICIALFLAFIVLKIIGTFREYFVIFQRRFRKRWAKILLRASFLILLIFIWGMINLIVISKFNMHDFSIKVHSKENLVAITAGEWSSYVFLMANALLFAVDCLMSFIDIFRKEPTGAKNFSWEKTRLYKIIQWFKDGRLRPWWIKFYSNYLE